MVLAALALFAAAGCGKKAELPPTHPVHGRVMFRGGDPVTAGIVCFQSQGDSAVSATGTIGPDGSFTLSSFIAGARAPGAVAGLHRVIVTPPRNAAQSAGGGQMGTFRSATLPEPVSVQEGDNNLTLVIPSPNDHKP